MRNKLIKSNLEYCTRFHLIFFSHTILRHTDCQANQSKSKYAYGKHTCTMCNTLGMCCHPNAFTGANICFASNIITLLFFCRIPFNSKILDPNDKQMTSNMTATNGANNIKYPYLYVCSAISNIPTDGTNERTKKQNIGRFVRQHIVTERNGIENRNQYKLNSNMIVWLSGQLCVYVASARRAGYYIHICGQIVYDFYSPSNNSKTNLLLAAYSDNIAVYK